MAWTFDRYVYNRRIQLAHEEIVRPLSMGNDWNTIRILVRFCVNDSARASLSTGPTGALSLYLGVRNGSTGPSFFSDTLGDWIGGGCIGNTFPASANTAFTASTPNYFSTIARPNALRKTGATTTFTSETSVNSFVVGSGQPGAFGAGFMCYQCVDIAKGSPNYTITPYYYQTAVAAQVNITDTVFMTALESTAALPANLTSGSAKTLAYSGAGVFDTLSIAAWRSFPHLEIDMIGVARSL